MPKISGPFDSTFFDEQYDENEEFGKPIDQKGMTDAEILAKMPFDWDVEFDSGIRSPAKTSVPSVAVNLAEADLEVSSDDVEIVKSTSPSTVTSKSSVRSVTDDSRLPSRVLQSHSDTTTSLSTVSSALSQPKSTNYVSSGLSSVAIKDNELVETRSPGKSERRLSTNIKDTLARLHSTLPPPAALPSCTSDDDDEIREQLFSPDDATKLDKPDSLLSPPLLIARGETSNKAPGFIRKLEYGDSQTPLSAAGKSAVDALKKIRQGRPEAPTPTRASGARASEDDVESLTLAKTFAPEADDQASAGSIVQVNAPLVVCVSMYIVLQSPLPCLTEYGWLEAAQQC